MVCGWTLPEGDADYATRIFAIKARFSMAVRRSGFTPTFAVGGKGAVGRRARVGTAKRVGVNPDLRKDEVAIWQKRYREHHIRDEADFAAHVRYRWVNPVKHGLVERVEDWPYSSWVRPDPAFAG